MSKNNGQKKPPEEPKTKVPDTPKEPTTTDSGKHEHFNGLHKISPDKRKTDVLRIRKAALPPLVTIKTEDYSEMVETLQVAGNEVEIENGEHWFIIWTA